MKDSGLSYIGKIPKTWTIKALKYSCDMYGRIGFRGYTVDDLVGEGEGAITLSPSNFSGMSLDYSRCSFLSWDKYYESPEIIVNKGDVLLVKTASVGKCVYVDNLPMEATVNPQILVLKNHKDCAKYVAYLLQTSIANAYFDTEKGGSTIYTISQEKIARFLFPFPPLSEQQRIADFLDRKCADIDNVLEKTKASIEEYRRLKQSVITEAVTKGVRGERPMKDSGIEWIGEIPADWRISKLRPLCSFYNGDRSSNYPTPDDFRDDGIPFCGADSLCGQSVDLAFARFISRKKYDSMGGLKVLKGDILYTLRGSTIGKNAMAMFNDGTVASSLMGIRVRTPLLHSSFLLYLLNSAIEVQQREICINGSTAPNLSADDVSTFKIPLPTIIEQTEISSYLGKKCSEIDSLIESKERFIKELEAYRKSLIYEYVTGKMQIPV